jgi:hypothetical protein
MHTGQQDKIVLFNFFGILAFVVLFGLTALYLLHSLICAIGQSLLRLLPHQHLSYEVLQGGSQDQAQMA